MPVGKNSCVYARYLAPKLNLFGANNCLAGTRVTLDMTTLTIMRVLPREVDPLVYHMAAEDPGKVSYSDIGTKPVKQEQSSKSLVDLSTRQIYFSFLSCVNSQFLFEWPKGIDQRDGDKCIFCRWSR
jgi:hypothetical protein